MFTGLIESVGRIDRIDRQPGGIRIALSAAVAGELSLGESLAVNGVCLTVVERDGTRVVADVSPETARVTTLGAVGEGALVNLERSLRADARIGGHFVLGHVDGTATIAAVIEEGDAHRLTVEFPEALSQYIVVKGSIAVDGVSLTVASVDGNRFDVQIIPFTWTHTNLAGARVGTLVNLECDILGKYAVSALDAHRRGQAAR
jgi:riboflavin synthase alpha subunit